MGSHPQVDESKNGWLATLGCCAPSTNNQDEDEEQFRGRRKSLEEGYTLVFDQPPATPRPRIEPEVPRPLTSYSMGQTFSSLVESGRVIAARASSRASTIRSRAWTGHSRKSRPSFTISAPTDFRRLDESDASPVPRRRRSFRPLELSIYLPENRLSPLPDFNSSDWDQVLAQLQCPAPALLRSRPSSTSTTPSTFRVQRKPVRSSVDGSGSSASHSRSSSQLSVEPPSVDISRPLSVLPWIDPLSSHPPTPPAHITQHPATGIARSDTLVSLPVPPKTVSRVNSPSPALSMRSRAMTEPTRGRSTPSPTPPTIPTKRGSVRRPNNAVDEAIRELNTIVEERRAADASRVPANSVHPSGVPPSPGHHIPAIAPSLRMHVRSETLSDIGSAFSVPLSSKPLPSTPFSPTAADEKRPHTAKPAGMTVAVDEIEKSAFEAEEGLSRPSTSGSMMAYSSTKSRISLWFRRQNRSRKNSYGLPLPEPAARQDAQPFYQCNATPTPRAHVHHASISSVSTYATTPSLSGRTERTSISIISPVSPETPTSKRSRSLQGAALNGTDCAKEAMPPVTQVIDGTQIASPLSPAKVGLAF